MSMFLPKPADADYLAKAWDLAQTKIAQTKEAAPNEVITTPTGIGTSAMRGSLYGGLAGAALGGVGNVLFNRLLSRKKGKDAPDAVSDAVLGAALGCLGGAGIGYYAGNGGKFLSSPSEVGTAYKDTKDKIVPVTAERTNKLTDLNPSGAHQALGLLQGGIASLRPHMSLTPLLGAIGGGVASAKLAPRVMGNWINPDAGWNLFSNDIFKRISGGKGEGAKRAWNMDNLITELAKSVEKSPGADVPNVHPRTLAIFKKLYDAQKASAKNYGNPATQAATQFFGMPNMPTSAPAQAAPPFFGPGGPASAPTATPQSISNPMSPPPHERWAPSSAVQNSKLVKAFRDAMFKEKRRNWIHAGAGAAAVPIIGLAADQIRYPGSPGYVPE